MHQKREQSPRFGIAGLPLSFKVMGYKNMWDVPTYLAAFGLNAFEYQCGHGVRLAAEKAAKMRAAGEAAGITYSLHAPYYISMASVDEEKRQNSVRYLLQSAEAVHGLGGTRVIFHCGSVGGQSRPLALEKAHEILTAARKALDEAGFEEIVLCPETGGKRSAIGSLEEILALCREDKRHVPCIDFGHLYARTGGQVCTAQHYADILDALQNELGLERARSFHAHFSKIEYTDAGEKRHCTFDTCGPWGPPYEPLMELLFQREFAPTIICESAGTQAEDARTMRLYYGQQAAG